MQMGDVRAVPKTTLLMPINLATMMALHQQLQRPRLEAVNDAPLALVNSYYH